MLKGLLFVLCCGLVCAVGSVYVSVYFLSAFQADWTGCPDIDEYYSGRGFDYDNRCLLRKGLVCRDTAPCVKALCVRYNMSCAYYTWFDESRLVGHIGVNSFKTES